MIAILIADYFVVRRRKLSLTQLFTNNEKSIYWFYHGVNPRTVVCFIVGTAPFMPGLVANINHKNLGGWTHLYYIGFVSIQRRPISTNATKIVFACSRWASQ